MKRETIHQYIEERLNIAGIKDFPGACNGLQVEGCSRVTKIGAAVDASLESIEKAVAAGVDFLIVHHGLFWRPIHPIVGPSHKKLKKILENDLNLYSVHLPLDSHTDIGNNACIVRALGGNLKEQFLPYEGTLIGTIMDWHDSREELETRLKSLFPKTFSTILYGSHAPTKIAVSSGSGAQVLPELLKAGVDTLITGELQQHNFSQAQEWGLNLYPCGHYATEVFGVQALAQELSIKFNLPWVFLESECLL